MAKQSALRSLASAVGWSLLQVAVYLGVFETLRNSTLFDPYRVNDPARGFFWQNFFFLFAALTTFANLWIARRRLPASNLLGRFGVWLSVFLILLFYCRAHLEARTAAVAIACAGLLTSIAIRELLERRTTRNSRNPSD